MRHQTLVGLACTALLTGCPSANQNQADPAESIGSGLASIQPVEATDQRWAEQIMAKRTQWETVTDKAVRANPDSYTLCRPGRTPETHGPHTYGPTFPKANEQAANQYLANPQARPSFYSTPDDPFRQPIEIDHPFAIGTTILKEKYPNINDAEKRIKAEAIAVMTKREPGYDPAHGDWEYGYIELDADGRIESVARGKIASCIDCHSNQAKNDYVFRSYPLMDKPEE